MFVIVNDKGLFWNSVGWTPEYPDATQYKSDEQAIGECDKIEDCPATVVRSYGEDDQETTHHNVASRNLTLEMPEKQDMTEEELENKRWLDDSIQFPRLLAEINATQIINYGTLEMSTDLTAEEIDQLFNRAEKKWQDIKDSMTK